MGLLSILSLDIEKMVKNGYSDKEIALALDVDVSLIKFIILFFRDKHSLTDPKII